MTKDENFKLLKIQTCVLKVNIHCDGCKQKVKKILQRIEGVYQVNVDAEQQKVTVSGSVDSATLIKKLIRAGKHAEVWSQKSNQNQKQNNNCIKDDKNNKSQKQGSLKGLETFKNQQKLPAFSSEEDDDYFNDDEEDDDEDDLRFLGPSQLGLLRQQIDNNNAKKNIGAAMAAVAANNGNKMNNNVGNGNVQKKGNPNQIMEVKVNPGGIDPKTMAALKMNQLGGGNINSGESKRGNDIATMMNLAGFHGKMNPGGIDQKTMAALKTNNAQLGGRNINSGESERGNDIATMMNLAGFHGSGGNIGNSAAAAAALGGNPYGLGGFQQVQSNVGYQGSSGAAGFPSSGYATGQLPSTMLTNMNGYNHPGAASMMMNRHLMQQQQQPQMMYHRSPFIPSNTGYYYNYSPALYPYTEPQPNYNGDNSAATHMFSDENTSSSCSIM